MASAEVLSRHNGEVVDGFSSVGVYAAVYMKAPASFGSFDRADWNTYRFDTLEGFVGFIAEAWEEVYCYRVWDIAEFTGDMYLRLERDIAYAREDLEKGGSDV